MKWKRGIRIRNYVTIQLDLSLFQSRTMVPPSLCNDDGSIFSVSDQILKFPSQSILFLGSFHSHLPPDFPLFFHNHHNKSNKHTYTSINVEEMFRLKYNFQFLFFLAIHVLIWRVNYESDALWIVECTDDNVGFFVAAV